LPVYGKTQIILSDRAFVGIVLSSIEVYKKECIGILLGIKSQGRIIVEYAIPLHAVTKRTYSEVVPNLKKELKLKEAIPKLMHLDTIGDFHSHPQFGDKKGFAALSDVDKESMDKTEIEIVAAINESKRRVDWKIVNGEVAGSICDYNFRLAGFYKKNNGGLIKQLDIVCPYAVGFNNAFNEVK
jgi:proteasome lid subunit RPN8/RPN11